MNISSYLSGHVLAAAAAAPGHGQVALGTKKVARTWTGLDPDLDLGGPDPAPLSSPPASLGHGLAPLAGHVNAQ